MTYGDAPLCSTLKSEELEDTFFYRGPNQVREKPSRLTQEHWDQAKEFCIECPIFLRCREQNWGQEYGVWGGTDQHERYLYRRRRQRELLRMDDQRRQAVAASMWKRAGGAGAPQAMPLSRQIGLSASAIKTLVREHEGRLAARRRERQEAAVAAMEAINGPTGPQWPTAAPPEGQGWVFRDGAILPAYYLAQTADGAWVRMKFRAAHMQPVRKWFRAEHVTLRFPVTPVIGTWSGEGKSNAA